MILGPEQAYSPVALERARASIEDALAVAAPFLETKGIAVSWPRDAGSVSFVVEDQVVASIHQRDGRLAFCDEVASEWDGRAHAGALPAHALRETIEAGLAHALWSRGRDRGSRRVEPEPHSPLFPYRG